MSTNITPISEQWAITEVNVRTFAYTWIINNFSFCKESPGEKLLSPPFSGGFDDKIKWQLELYPMADKEEYKSYTVIILVLLNGTSDKSEVHAKCKLSILNAKREQLKSKESTLGLITKQDYKINNYYILRKDLFNKDLGLLPKDKLTIFCEVSVVGDNFIVSGHSTDQRAVPEVVPECRLAQDLGALLDQERFWDVTLVAGGKELHAHRNVLAARSAVFAAMFEHPLEERAWGRVHIDDVKPDVLAELLRFVYTGCAPHLTEMADALLVAADKYALEGLKSMCEEVLAGSLTVETAAATLMRADLLSANQLKAQTIDFIVAGRLAPVIDIEGWTSLILSRPELSIEVLGAVAAQQKRVLPAEPPQKDA